MQQSNESSEMVSNLRPETSEWCLGQIAFSFSIDMAEANLKWTIGDAVFDYT